MIDTLQTIVDFQDCTIEHDKWSQNAIEDYMGLKSEINTIRLLINNGSLSPQFGTGNPNGVVTSNYSLKYIDTVVPTEYYNPDFGTDTGWIAL